MAENLNFWSTSVCATSEQNHRNSQTKLCHIIWYSTFGT